MTSSAAQIADATLSCFCDVQFITSEFRTYLIEFSKMIFLLTTPTILNATQYIYIYIDTSYNLCDNFEGNIDPFRSNKQEKDL